MPDTTSGAQPRSCAAVLAASLLFASTAAAQLTWSPAPGQVPPARTATAAALSYHNFYTVLFGGEDAAGGTLGDTWRFDGVNWTPMPGAAPAPRSRHAMATRAADHIVLFGGRDANGSILADAWQWVANTQTWQSLPGGPPPRESAAFATRLDRDAVLFGGRNGAVALGDTWLCREYASPMWSNPTFAVAPPARHGHAMAAFASQTVPQTVRMVLFGGVDASGNHLDDTWILEDTASGPAWVLAAPAVRPSPRRGHAMRFDSHRGRAQLFGGEGPNGLLGDTWEWDGNTWWSIVTSGTPAPRTDAVLVDAAHWPGPVPLDGLLFGGRDAAGPLAQAWTCSSSVPAAVAFFGSSTLLRADVLTMPWLGGPLTLLVQGAPGSGSIVIPHAILGFSNTTSPLGPLPLDLGPALDHAVLRVDPAVLLPLAPAWGSTFAITLSLPALPSIVGTHLYAQGIAFLPALSPPVWATTRGIDCTLGWL